MSVSKGMEIIQSTLSDSGKAFDERGCTFLVRPGAEGQGPWQTVTVTEDSIVFETSSPVSVPNEYCAEYSKFIDELNRIALPGNMSLNPSDGTMTYRTVIGNSYNGIPEKSVVLSNIRKGFEICGMHKMLMDKLNHLAVEDGMAVPGV